MTSLSLYTLIETLPKKMKLEARFFIEMLQVKYAQKNLPSKEGQKGKRTFGSLKGRISTTEDFDAPLEDFEPYM